MRNEEKEVRFIYFSKVYFTLEKLRCEYSDKWLV